MATSDETPPDFFDWIVLPEYEPKPKKLQPVNADPNANYVPPSLYPHEYFNVDFTATDDYSGQNPHISVESIKQAHVMTSAIKGKPNKHTIMLDIDVPAMLVPSSTPGHSHLYIDVEVDSKTYFGLLRALREAGVIQEGFLKFAIERGATYLRLPWIKKEKK